MTFDTVSNSKFSLNTMLLSDQRDVARTVTYGSTNTAVRQLPTIRMSVATLQEYPVVDVNRKELDAILTIAVGA